MEELKSRVRVSDVVGRHVKLRRQGREFAGLSPFTNEKTPSFFVNDQKGFYHCFSSGKHGDSISFLMEVQGLSFPEAVEHLAGLAGMELPKSDPKAEQRARERKEAISWMERAQDHFEKTLYRAPGEAAREYLKGRGLSKTAARIFGLGFAEDSFSALKDNLIREGADEKQLVEAGLLIEPEDRNRASWDRFRNRIMFPIHDARGRLVAFGGRAMSDDQKAKYLNSPETPLFSKGSLLYNYHRARAVVSDPKTPANGLIVVEGYMDVIALARAGYGQAVAPLGTALTEDQLALIWRAGSDGYLCFDGDKAGLRAAYRSIERALPLLKPGQSLRFVMMPEGQDPDDLIREKGAPAFGALLERSVALVDMLWRREVEREPLGTPEAIAGLKNRLYDALREIKDPSVREAYYANLLGRYDKQYGRSTKRGGWTGRREPKETKADKATIASGAARLASQTRQANTLLGGILLFPELLEHVDEAFFAMKFPDMRQSALQSETLRYWRQTKAVDITGLHAHMQNRGLEGELKDCLSRRGLIIAALGGREAETGDRAAIWMEEADTFTDQTRNDAGSPIDRSRMADTIRENNSEAMHRLMRARARSRE